MKNNLLIVMLLVCYYPGLLAQEIEKKTKQKQVPISPADSLPLWKDDSLLDPERIYNPVEQDAPYEKSYRQLSAGLMKQKSPKIPAYYRYAIPASLITYGALSFALPPVKELDHSIRDQVIASGQERIHFDDFIQFMPAVAVYGLDLCTPLKAKHSFRDRTIVMATSHLLMAGTVHGLKNTVNVTRPDNSARNSFPSGHTATAFTGAHILFREYKDQSVWIGVAGYAAATSTGVFRILNNRHWLSDVMAGAGIGILSAEVGYLLLPVFKNMMGLKDTRKTFVIAPVAQAEQIGVGMSYTF